LEEKVLNLFLNRGKKSICVMCFPDVRGKKTLEISQHAFLRF